MLVRYKVERRVPTGTANWLVWCTDGCERLQLTISMDVFHKLFFDIWRSVDVWFSGCGVYGSPATKLLGNDRVSLLVGVIIGVLYLFFSFKSAF